GVEAAVDLVLERREVDLARLFKPLELVEEDLGVLEIGLAFDARRAAECEPRAPDALAPGTAQPVLHQRPQARRAADCEPRSLDALAQGTAQPAPPQRREHRAG